MGEKTLIKQKLLSPLITPFNKNNTLDSQSLIQTLEQLTFYEITPILFTEMSEVYQLDSDEVIEIIKVASSRKKPSETLGLNLFSSNLKFNLELAKTAKELNFDFLTLSTKTLIGEEIGNYLYQKQLLDQTELPIAVEVDHLPLSVIKKISEHKNILALITNDGSEKNSALKVFSNNSHIISTNSCQFPNLYNLGHNSLFSPEALAFPAEIDRYFQQTLKRQLDGKDFFYIRKQLGKLAPFLGASSIKQILFNAGIISTSIVRLPQSELDLPCDSTIEDLIEAFTYWGKSTDN